MNRRRKFEIERNLDGFGLSGGLTAKELAHAIKWMDVRGLGFTVKTEYHTSNMPSGYFIKRDEW